MNKETLSPCLANGLSRWLVVVLLSLQFFVVSAQSYTAQHQQESTIVKSDQRIDQIWEGICLLASGKMFMVESQGVAIIKASQRIELHPGLHIENGAYFVGSIESPDESLTKSSSEETKRSINVFPIPAETVVNIESPTPIRLVQIRDLNGVIVYKEGNVNGKTFGVDISTFKKGQYILEVTLDKNIERSRIIKR